MDNFYHDIRNKRCIIYSFGIADHYAFESDMGKLGCVVHAYDPTVELPSSPTKNVHFKKIGLGHFTGNMKVRSNNDPKNLTKPLPVTTLKDAIVRNGDFGKEITYIKVDIESAELKAIPEWIESGILKNVRQIGIELHTGQLYVDKKDRPRVTKSLLKSMLQMYDDLGFRHVSYSPNTCVGKDADSLGKRYYTFMDIVLYKPYTYEMKQEEMQ